MMMSFTLPVKHGMGLIRALLPSVCTSSNCQELRNKSHDQQHEDEATAHVDSLSVKCENKLLGPKWSKAYFRTA